ncbi:hypothetical protein [Anatilimnocola floriformis]|uniref:hypothetical protein n=1 Tax=Anatilimnocola floriformis TaxID=2948575 RepID=UPI0020C2DB9A|nr:hypothetical protein [Anatilimnocola floriformis]
MFFRRHVRFHEVAYVAKVTDKPPMIHFIKHDGKEVIIQGGTQPLLQAFKEIAARFPLPT